MVQDMDGREAELIGEFDRFKTNYFWLKFKIKISTYSYFV
jgi:hypothetical protein